MNQVKRTPGEKRPSVQREVASVLDRYRAARDVDQAELATAIGCSPSYARRILERSDPTTIDLADVAMMADSDVTRGLGEDLVRWLADRYGLSVTKGEAAADLDSAVDDIAAEGGGLPRMLRAARADGRIDDNERDQVEGKLRTIEAGVQRTRAGLRSVAGGAR